MDLAACYLQRRSTDGRARTCHAIRQKIKTTPATILYATLTMTSMASSLHNVIFYFHVFIHLCIMRLA